MDHELEDAVPHGAVVQGGGASTALEGGSQLAREEDGNSGYKVSGCSILWMICGFSGLVIS